MELKMAFHARTKRRVVEVYDNAGVFVALIVPDEDKSGIKITSKSFHQHWHDEGTAVVPHMPEINVTFRRAP